jgi:hypothetical protein
MGSIVDWVRARMDLDIFGPDAASFVLGDLAVHHTCQARRMTEDDMQCNHRQVESLCLQYWALSAMSLCSRTRSQCLFLATTPRKSLSVFVIALHANTCGDFLTILTILIAMYSYVSQRVLFGLKETTPAGESDAEASSALCSCSASFLTEFTNVQINSNYCANNGFGMFLVGWRKWSCSIYKWRNATSRPGRIGALDLEWPQGFTLKSFDI